MVNKDFGVGIVLGNNLSGWNHLPEEPFIPGDDWETGWGNKRITRETIRGMKAMGFRTVRVPVTWIEHFTKKESGEWEMAEWFIRRVKEVVEMVTAEGLYCVINVHHDTDFLILDDEETVRDKFFHLWRYIAEYFKGFETDLLCFESFNEIGETERPERDIPFLGNLLNELFYEAVRGVDKKRTLFFEGYYADTMGTFIHSVFPADDNALIAVHFYTPWEFTIQDPEEYKDTNHNLFSKEQVAGYLSYIEKIQKRFGMNVCITEFSCHMAGRRPDKVLDWYTMVFKYCKEHGVPLFIWDNGRPQESVIDRESHAFMLPGLDKLMAYYYGEE